MAKILKKVQLSTEQVTQKSADPTKGTLINPFTQAEMEQFQEMILWKCWMNFILWKIRN